VTKGGRTEKRASATGGKSWDTGNVLFVYEYFNQGNLSADDRAFAQGALLPNDLLPGQERHSVLASVSQELTPDLELFADFIFSQREAEQNFTTTTGDVFRSTPSSENLNVSAGGVWKVSDDWFFDFSGTYSDLNSEPRVAGAFPAMRDTDSTVWTADVKASGAAFGLPGGDVMLAVGGHYRGESFTNIRLDTDTIEQDADRDVYAVFGEAFIPIVGPDNAIPGIERLELNVSGRFEDYNDFGSSTNPKVGILWSPAEALRLRGSYSTSFNPPPLGRVGAMDTLVLIASTAATNSIFGFTPADPSIADVIAITVVGTGKGLEAETSTAFTAGMDFSEQWGRHDFTFSTTWFDIEFKNRLGTTPIPGNRDAFDAPNIAFSSPETFPAGTIIFSPTVDNINNVLDRANTTVSLGGDPLNAQIINFADVTRNLARTSVSGFDFDVAYAFDSDLGNLLLGLNGTYLLNFQQQSASTTPLIDQVNTLYNPVDLKLRGRAGYSHNGVTANIFVNYTDGYSVDSTIGAASVDSWTTVDVSLSYDTQERFENRILDNTNLRLSIINLFDENPPSAPSVPIAQIFGFDPTNASPLNRFVSFELTKAF